MKKCTLIIKDEVNIQFVGVDPETRRKLINSVKFKLPYAHNLPAVRLGRWDGTVAYCDLAGRSYYHLLERLLPVLVAANYDIDIDDRRPEYTFEFNDIDTQSYTHVKWPAGHPLAGQGIEVRQHQVDAVNSYLKNMQSVNILPTGAGKTLVTGILSEKVQKYGKSVTIVPSKDLVIQTEEDFINLGLDVGVLYGDRKDLTKTHTICTWQSLDALIKRSKAGEAEITITEFLEDVICVIVDEAHRTKGTVLRDMLTNYFSHVPIRWAMTGTLPEDDIGKFALLLSVGPVSSTLKASTLQEKGILANLDIEVWQLNDFSESVSTNYQAELKWLTTNQKRLKYLADNISTLAEENGNTLILIDRIETGEILSQLIPGSVFLDGSIKSSKRKDEYKSIQFEDGKVLIATFGIASTGISISRLFNLVLFEPGKSFVRVIQSIGRGLRVAEDKTHVKVIDVASTCKYSKRHLTKRKQFYKEAGYPYKVIKKDY